MSVGYEPVPGRIARIHTRTRAYTHVLVHVCTRVPHTVARKQGVADAVVDAIIGGHDPPFEDEDEVGRLRPQYTIHLACVQLTCSLRTTYVQLTFSLPSTCIQLAYGLHPAYI